MIKKLETLHGDYLITTIVAALNGFQIAGYHYHRVLRWSSVNSLLKIAFSSPMNLFMTIFSLKYQRLFSGSHLFLLSLKISQNFHCTEFKHLIKSVYFFSINGFYTMSISFKFQAKETPWVFWNAPCVF